MWTSCLTQCFGQWIDRWKICSRLLSLDFESVASVLGDLVRYWGSPGATFVTFSLLLCLPEGLVKLKLVLQDALIRVIELTVAHLIGQQ